MNIMPFTVVAIILLGAGTVAIAWRRRWHLVTLTGLVYSFIISGIVADFNLQTAYDLKLLMFAPLIVIFSAATTVYALTHREKITCRNFLMLAAAQIVFTLFTAIELYRKFDAPTITAFAPGFTAVIDAVLATVAMRRKSGGRLLAFGAFVLGVAMLATVMFIALDNCTLTATLVALSIVVLYFARKSESIAVYITGVFALIAAALALIAIDTNQYFVNQTGWLECLGERLISLGGLTLGAAAASRFATGTEQERKQCKWGFGAIALALLFSELTIEVNFGFKFNYPAAQPGAVSVVWAVYALALIAAGFRWQIQVLRGVGLALFAVTVGKVFLYDLETVKALYRVGALLIFGLLLLGGAFTYIKLKDRL